MEALSEPVDQLVHQPDRLGILAVLCGSPATFSELKHDSELTDGNLDGHLRKLEGAGYVKKEMKKNPLVRRQWETVYGITGRGRKAFDDYLATMERKLQEARSITKQ